MRPSRSSRTPSEVHWPSPTTPSPVRPSTSTSTCSSRRSGSLRWPGRWSELGAAADDPAVIETVHRDGQVRVLWDDTPIDLFFSYDPFHDAAARDVRNVPFGDTTIPVLGPEHLVVCKVVFDRPKDWVDIEAMLDAGTSLNAAEVLRWVGRIAGDDDARYDRVAALLSR